MARAITVNELRTGAYAGPLGGKNDMTLGTLRFLYPNPALEGEQAHIANLYWNQALGVVGTCPEGPQLTTALNLLVQSKDSAVRATL